MSDKQEKKLTNSIHCKILHSTWASLKKHSYRQLYVKPPTVIHGVYIKQYTGQRKIFRDSLVMYKIAVDPGLPRGRDWVSFTNHILAI